MTTANPKRPEEERILTKDEMNLAEYPLMLMSRRVPDGVKTIEYADWTTIDGEKRPLRWTVTGSDKYGLPVGGDQDVLVAVMEIWREDGYRDRCIPVGSLYHMLKRIGLQDDGRTYRRLRAALDRLTGTTIYAENAFWDRDHKCYIARQAFHIFEDYYFLDRFRPNEGTMPLPIGYIRASSFFYESVKHGNLKDLDLTLYRQLPSPLSRRLYRYLDKKRYHGIRFSMHARKLAAKLGMITRALEQYRPAKLKQILVPALSALQEQGFLKSYSFEQGKEGAKLTVEFMEQGGSGTKGGFYLPGQEEAAERFAYLVEEILEVTGDAHSRAYYELLARELSESRVWGLISATKEAKRAKTIKTTAAQFFTDLAEEARGKRSRDN